MRSLVEFSGLVGGSNLRRYDGSRIAKGRNFIWKGYAGPSRFTAGQPVKMTKLICSRETDHRDWKLGFSK
jgi:hypothetical protein